MNCPVCLLDLIQPIPSFCPKCAWDLKNDMTRNTFLSSIPDSEFDIYRNRVKLARQNWEHLQLIKKELADKMVGQENSILSKKVLPGRITNAKDGSRLVLIPEGEFLAGGPAEDEGNGEPFPVWLPAYYLALYPVTNIQYVRFLSQVRPSERDLKEWIDLDSECFVRKTGSRYEAYGNKNDHPVLNVSWYGANDYAKWAGLRLPCELEWEKGSRGVEGQEYPWGNTWDKWKCRNDMNRGDETTCSVQSYPEGRSRWGLYQMSGNVWEWCEDWYNSEAYNRYRQGELSPSEEDEDRGRVLRGGSWGSDVSEYFRGAYRRNNEPECRFTDCGFRLARTVTL